MAEDLTKIWRSFSLTEEEDVDVVIQKKAMEGMENRGVSCLVGKLLFDKFVGKDKIMSTLIRW